MQNFVFWNPAVGNDCNGVWADAYYCVDTSGTPTTRPASSTKPITTGDGVSTPLPTEPGMVSNCNKFHFANKCSQVISYQKITREDFVRWYPNVNSDCSGMQADVNVYVGVIEGLTTTTKLTTTTTTAGNGIQTPQSTQPEMVVDCKKNHFAAKGVVCSQLTSYSKITLADFVKSNPGVGADCRNMWADNIFASVFEPLNDLCTGLWEFLYYS